MEGFAVADDLNLEDLRDLRADQLEDRTAVVAGDAFVGARTAEILVQEGQA